MKVFISHSSRDKWAARRISDDLNRLGVETFLDEKDIETGETIDDTISIHLKECDECLLLLSPSSLNSHWVLIEIGGAKALGKRLVPILLHIGVNDMPSPISKHLARDINEIEKYYEEVQNRLAGHLPLPRQAAIRRARPIPLPRVQSFKVGDVVRLPKSRPRSVMREDVSIDWTEDMDEYFGEQAMILEVDSDRTVLLDIDDSDNWWAFEWLTKV
ncbi:MAG TPA: TIR domain-containing protein [Pyrinomonadaceae bacterium]|nr:TIR domain-containing protein [Pyrinomonadaceae bacterium]